MSFLPRLVLISLLILAAGTRGQAQVHEQAPLPGLDKGLLLTADAPTLGSARLAGDVGTGDFSLVLNVGLNALDDLVLYRNEGWQLQLRRDGSLSFSATESANAQPTFVATRPAALSPQARASIVISVKRDARQPYTGIWVNGIELASGVMPPVRCSPASSPVQCDSDKLKSVSLKVYDRALVRTEVVDSAMDFLKPLSSKPAANSPGVASGKDDPYFAPKDDETIALIGGTEAVALAESGELEAELLTSYPQTHFHFRSLAWEGDTVFRQDRPMNFGSLEQQLRRVNAGAVIMMFGRQECLDAPLGAPSSEFKEAFGKLLAEVEKVTSRVVVVSPMPFEKKPSPLPDLGARDGLMKQYTDVMRAEAEARGAKFHDAQAICQFFTDRLSRPLTTDGVTLTPSGRQIAARIAAGHMGVADHDSSTGQRRVGTSYEYRLSPDLLSEVRAKNHLWHDYWRPSNWAFLYGDRTNQPSSRDPVNSQVRFFPSEQEKYLPLIKEAEGKVYRTVEEQTKKLP